MRQTLAIFLDAYRELNSKKLFWVSIYISIAIVLALAIPGQTDNGIQIFSAKLESGPFEFLFRLMSSKSISGGAFYKFLYSWVGISIWLGWGATALALLSTAGMIPDLVSGGAIEMTLSKPISRMRLFLTKYCAGLLFVALQAFVFSFGAILVIGIRGGAWDVRPLLIVPIMVAFFSFLHAISVLVGLVTRSTLVALIVVVLCWLAIGGLGFAENALYQERVGTENALARLESQKSTVETALKVLADRMQQSPPEKAPNPDDSGAQSVGTPPSAPAAASDARSATGSPADSPPIVENRRRQRNPIATIMRQGRDILQATTDQDPESLRQRKQALEAQIKRIDAQVADTREGLQSKIWWHRALYSIYTMLPKTGEVKGLFERWAIDKSDWTGVLKTLEQFSGGEADTATGEKTRNRPLWWILGTSFAFEGVLLGIACWIFCRRDF